jgi:hypothetical protein
MGQGRAEHLGDGGAIDIGIHHADAVPLSREGCRKVRGDRGFPHPTLAADDSNLVADCRYSGLEQGMLLLDLGDNIRPAVTDNVFVTLHECTLTLTRSR